MNEAERLTLSLIFQHNVKICTTRGHTYLLHQTFWVVQCPCVVLIIAQPHPHKRAGETLCNHTADNPLKEATSKLHCCPSGRGFIDQSNLIRHLCTHTEEKEHQVDLGRWGGVDYVYITSCTLHAQWWWGRVMASSVCRHSFSCGNSHVQPAPLVSVWWVIPLHQLPWIYEEKGDIHIKKVFVYARCLVKPPTNVPSVKTINR